VTLKLKARWLRFWHSLFHLHQDYTIWEKWPFEVKYVGCYTCGKEWK